MELSQDGILILQLFGFSAGVTISAWISLHLIHTILHSWGLMSERLPKQIPLEIDTDGFWEGFNSVISPSTPEKPKRKEKRKNSEPLEEPEFVYVHTNDPQLIEVFRNEEI